MTTTANDMGGQATKSNGLTWLNSLSTEDAVQALHKCCGAQRWVDAMVARRPFVSEDEAHRVGDEIWNGLTDDDFLEALRHHPKIGDLGSLRDKFASTSAWAENEQSGVNAASEDVLIALHQGNEEYEKKFGFIFVVCATGKRADEMLTILRERLPNERAAEIRIAAGEQQKITNLRLEKLWQQQQA